MQIIPKSTSIFAENFLSFQLFSLVLHQLYSRNTGCWLSSFCVHAPQVQGDSLCIGVFLYLSIVFCSFSYYVIHLWPAMVRMYENSYVVVAIFFYRVTPLTYKASIGVFLLGGLINPKTLNFLGEGEVSFCNLFWAATISISKIHHKYTWHMKLYIKNQKHNFNIWHIYEILYPSQKHIWGTKSYI